MQPSGLRLVTLGRLELIGAGEAGESLNRRRRKLAVLALLALERRPVPRERLLEMFWGEQPEANARHSLSDAISHLRRVLGADAVVARPDGILLDGACPRRLAVDALDLEVAERSGEWERALTLATGEFLAGVTVANSTSYDEWVEAQRAHLRAHVARACGVGCDALAERGHWDDAAVLGMRWVGAAPDSAAAQRFLDRARAATAERPSDEALLPIELRERWWRAAAGRRQLVALWGDRARETGGALAALAWREGAAVVAARAYMGEQGTPRRLFGEVVRGLLDLPGLAGTDPAQLARLGRVVPEVCERFPCSPDADASPAQIADALRAALESVAYEAPLLVRVDDVHRADPESREMLRAALQAAGGPMAAVLTGDEASLAPLVAGAGSDAILVGAGAPRRPTGRVRAIARRANGRPLVALALSAAVLLIAAVAAGTRGPPVLAVGAIEDRTGGDTSAARVLPELLATSLARVEQLRVLSRGRVYEGLAAGGREETPAAVAAAARSVGATELLEGTLYRRGGRLRLELREVTLGSGVVRRAAVAEAADAFALADSATLVLARAHGARLPDRPLREVTSTSLVARRFYDEGLRALYSGQTDRAYPLFEAALREDSSFAMAAHYAAMHYGGFDYPRVTRALRLAERATDRERLLIRASWLLELNDPRGAAVAETLAVRYADEPEGMVLLGRSLEARGDFASAMIWLRRAVQRDSVGLRRGTAVCHACAALGVIKSAAMFAGAFREAEDALRHLAATYADDQARGRMWMEIALVRARDERLADARAAVDSALRHDPTIEPGWVQLQILIRAGELTEAERLLRARFAGAGPSQRYGAYMELAPLVRLQGRYAEALRLSRTMRALGDTLHDAFANGARQLAVTEMVATPRAAAPLLDSMAARPLVGREFAARNARHRAWMLTHAATALAAAGDTTRLAALVDTVRVVGAQSDYARDQRLHHYIHALLLEARGDTAAAVASLLRARYSATETYFGLRLARDQLALGRVRDAAATAESALRGPLDSQNQYEPRIELHALLAQAYDRMGDRARAARHYRMVARCWARGDAPWAARAEAAARRARELESR
ncbi:MAG: hypothetical protein ACJ8AO_16735 [Gemmatimonadaceae bacterium]